MVRDIRGHPVKSEAAEPIKYGAAKDKDSKTTERKGKVDADPQDMLQNHHDRLAAIEEHLGLAKKADAFKDEDQGGKGKIGAGHVSERGGPTYERKRH
jgi:hypothetical protein